MNAYPFFKHLLSILCVNLVKFIVFDFYSICGPTMKNNYALIIADNSEIAEKFSVIFEQPGYQSLAVSTGAGAQVQLAFTNPDVIVLDMDLPDIPGEIILRQIKAHTRLKNSILILITGDAEMEKNLQPQADLVLSNPLNLNKVNNLVINSVGVSGG